MNNPELKAIMEDITKKHPIRSRLWDVEFKIEKYLSNLWFRIVSMF